MKSNLPKRVLVTGAQGALGSEVVDKYLNAGCRVFATYFTHSEILPAARESLEWIHVDLTDSRWVRTAFGRPGSGTPQNSQNNFDAWIHCAGGFRFNTVENTSD